MHACWADFDWLVLSDQKELSGVLGTYEYQLVEICSFPGVSAAHKKKIKIVSGGQTSEPNRHAFAPPPTLQFCYNLEYPGDPGLAVPADY